MTIPDDLAFRILDILERCENILPPTALRSELVIVLGQLKWMIENHHDRD